MGVRIRGHGLESGVFDVKNACTLEAEITIRFGVLTGFFDLTVYISAFIVHTSADKAMHATTSATIPRIFGGEAFRSREKFV